jgi:hypothetical protein
VEGRAHRALELALVVGPRERVERLALLGIEAVGREGVVDHHVEPAQVFATRSTSACACPGTVTSAWIASPSPPAWRHACGDTSAASARCR